MTREEQIKQAEVKYSDNTLFDGCDYIGQVAKQEAFIAGAKWADKHPKEGLISIDNVEKYLKKHIILYSRTTTLDQQKEWFNNFRKSIEE